MRILLDTNVLARSAQPDHPQYPAARDAVKALLERGEELFVVPQNLYEFWAVATRQVHENGLGLSVEESVRELSTIKRVFVLLRDEAIVQKWERLVTQHEVKGKKTHDARLVAAMKRHGLTHILTFNAQDFVRFEGVTVLTPVELVRGN